MLIKAAIRSKSRHAPSGSFAAHVLTLMTGTSIAQAIPIAVAPILTRLYTPKEFGIFALFTSVVSIPAIIATGRYELAIMLPDNDRDAVNLLALSVIMSISFSIITFLVVLLFNKQIATLLGNQEIAPWLYWVPLSVFFTGLYQAFNYWSSRKKLYNGLAASRMYQSASVASINLLLGFGGFGVSGLISGNIIGQGFASGVLLRRLWQDCKVIKHDLSIEAVRINAARYRDFPFVNSFHALIDVVQTGGVVFVISIYFGSVVVGLYSLAFNILRVPLNLIGSSVAQVFYQKASEAYCNGEQLPQLLKSTILKLCIVALPIFIFIFIFAPTVFIFVFGQNWGEAGRYIQILSPWLFLNFIISPISQIPIIVKRQKTAFAIGIIYNFVILAPLFLAAYFGQEMVTGLYLVSFSASIVLIFYAAWILKISNAVCGKS